MTSSTYKRSIVHTIPVIYKSGHLAGHRSQPKVSLLQKSSFILLCPLCPLACLLLNLNSMLHLNHLKTLKYATGLECCI